MLSICNVVDSVSMSRALYIDSSKHDDVEGGNPSKPCGGYPFDLWFVGGLAKRVPS